MIESGKRKKGILRLLGSTLLTIFIPVVIAVILRVFFIEMYKIPSSSMEPTLVPGDFILVNKMNYGARLLKLRKFFREKRIEYERAIGWGKIRRGDVLVFNWPNYGSLTDTIPNTFGDCIVKRLYGMPGDTVIIKNKKLFDFENEGKPNLFPYDTSLNWTIDHYGPLFVPGKGFRLKLTPENAFHYQDVLKYEGYKVKVRNDSVFLNDQYSPYCRFSHNYYFMKGDNFYGSQDSRYWGFVPEENIIGKAGLVLFSYGENGEKSWKWNRLFMHIK